MKKLGLLFCVLLLSSALASAAAFTVDVSPVKDRIKITEYAIFNLTIHNSAQSGAQFTIEKPDYPRWDITTPDNANPILIDVPAGGSASLILYLDPNQNYIGGRGSHSVNIGIKNLGTGEIVLTRANVGIVDNTQPAYTPTVILTTDFPSEVNPSKPLEFTITLSNQNKLDITDAVLRITSKLMDEEMVIALGPDEEKVVDVRVPLNPQTPAMDDTVMFSLKYFGEEVFLPTLKPYRVSPYTDLSQTEQVKERFLRTDISITFHNSGNVPYVGQVTVAANPWKGLFLYTKPQSTYRKGAFFWDANIPPGGDFTVTVVETYLWLLIAAIVAVLVWALVTIQRLPILLTKRVTQVESKEGNLIGMKVLVTVKNRSAAKLEDVVVLEKLPKLLELERGATIGSLPPTKVFKNERQETFVKWELAALGPDEERVVNYSLKSSFQILGGLTLTPAVVTAKQNGKEVKALSQAPKVLV